VVEVDLVEPEVDELLDLRAVLSHIGMELISPQVSVPNAGDAFDEDGDFREERFRKGMTRLCRTLIEHARLLTSRIEA